MNLRKERTGIVQDFGQKTGVLKGKLSAHLREVPLEVVPGREREAEGSAVQDDLDVLLRPAPRDHVHVEIRAGARVSGATDPTIAIARTSFRS